jgi:hypothetical protein
MKNKKFRGGVKMKDLYLVTYEYTEYTATDTYKHTKTEICYYERIMHLVNKGNIFILCTKL